jgi:hypothetical protein
MYKLKHDWARPSDQQGTNTITYIDAFDHFLLEPHEPGRNRDLRILLSEAESRLDVMVIRR